MSPIWLSLAAVLLVLVVILSSKSTAPRPVAELPEPGPDVHALINEKRKVDAIKLYRKQTSASLMEAKQVIEHYTEPLAASSLTVRVWTPPSSRFAAADVRSLGSGTVAVVYSALR